MLQFILLCAQQTVLMVVLAALPLVWLGSLGGFRLVDILYSHDYGQIGQMVMAADVQSMITSTGITCLAFALAYHKLPIPLFPVAIPLLGRMDMHITKLIGLVGISLLLANIIH